MKKLYCPKCGFTTKQKCVGKPVDPPGFSRAFATIMTLGAYALVDAVIGERYYKCQICGSIHEHEAL